MKNSIKIVTSLALLFLAGTAVAGEADDGSTREARRTAAPIQTCVAEIAQNAEYDDATKVVHRVTKLYQQNLLELHIHVETAVFADDEEAATRSYSTSCLVGNMGDLVRFRLVPVEPANEAA